MIVSNKLSESHELPGIAALERMFSADEVTSVVDPARLKRLKHEIVSLFLYDTGGNQGNS
jgi:hypothetical protein